VRHAADAHPVVADGADLLDAVALRESVEMGSTPSGAMSDHNTTALEPTKPPKVKCCANGAKRISPSTVSRKAVQRRVTANVPIAAVERTAYPPGKIAARGPASTHPATANRSAIGMTATQSTTR
jgi:hypothetical protein